MTPLMRLYGPITYKDRKKFERIGMARESTFLEEQWYLDFKERLEEEESSEGFDDPKEALDYYLAGGIIQGKTTTTEDEHLYCYSYPCCDESIQGCVVRFGSDAEPYGHRD